MAFKTTYNGQAWFLFPYVLLSITSGLIFKSIERWGARRVLPVTVFLNYGAMFLISRYFTAYFASHYLIYQVVVYFDCLLAFMTGALFCRHSDYEVSWKWSAWLTRHQVIMVLLLLALFLLDCIVNSFAFSPIYMPLFVVLFIHIRWGRIAKSVLGFLGKYSTVVWLVHSWFCYNLFSDFIYGFHYPLLIICVEFAVSIALGYVIMQLTRKLYRLLGI